MSLVSPVMPRSPRTQAAASALVIIDPTRADTGRARKRSTVEVAEEDVRKVTLATTKLKKELDKLLLKGAPTAGRQSIALQNKKTKFYKSRDQTLPSAQARLVEGGFRVLGLGIRVLELRG